MEIINPQKKSIVYYSFILLFILLVFAALYYGRKFLIPVSLATLFAMLLWPVAQFFERKGVSRKGSAGICTSILFLFLVAFCLFFASQVANFSSQLPNLQSKLGKKQEQFKGFLQNKLGVNTENLFPGKDSGSSSGTKPSSGSGQGSTSKSESGSDSKSNASKGSGSSSGTETGSGSTSGKKSGKSESGTGSAISGANQDSSSNSKSDLTTSGKNQEPSNSNSNSNSNSISLSSMFSGIMKALKSIAVITFKTVVGIIIILAYVFLMLLYRHIFLQFIIKLSPQKKEAMVISKNIAKVSNEYLAGRLIVIGILAVINSIGLTLIGIKQGIFFGVLAALLDLIPYIGIIIGAGLPLIVSLVTKSSIWPFFAVLGLFLFVQLLENYFLTPKIVGSKVRLNPLFTIMAVLVGGYLWGVAGMILFIPFLGMLKVLFDHVEPLHPYGFLVGDPANRSKKE